MEDRVPRCVSTIRRICGIIAFALVASTALAQGQPQAPAQLETTLSNMLTALQNNSLADFVSGGDAAFQYGMTQQMLSGLNAQFGPGLKRGYTTTFLGTLNQEGHTVYLWKISFKDGQDDRLFTMAVKDGKVSGFFLR